MPLLSEEIICKEEILFKESGVKEKLFYAFVTKRGFPREHTLPEPEVDKVCYAAFSGQIIDVNREIQRYINAEPIHGIHVGNNLITLVAFCILSNEARQKYLNLFYARTSYTNQFLISRSLNDPTLEQRANVVTVFDSLIEKTFALNDLESAQKKLAEAFTQVSDLTELAAVYLCYEELLRIHPNKKLEDDIQLLKMGTELHMRFVRKTLIGRINTLVLMVGILIIPGIVVLTKRYWNEWDLEPILSGLSLASPVVSVLIVYFLSGEDKNKIVTNFKERLITKWYLKRGIDKESMDEILRAGNKK